jgi:hypothetical protein
MESEIEKPLPTSSKERSKMTGLRKLYAIFQKLRE